MAKLLNWIKDRSLFIGIAVLLVFIPLYPKFPYSEIPGTYVAIRFEDFVVAFLVLLFLTKILMERTNLFTSRLNRLILIYFLIGALSSLSAIMITKNVTPHLVILHWLRRIEYMSLFFIAAASIKKWQDVKDYLIMIFLTTCGVIVYGVGQKFYGFPVVSTMNKEFSKGLILPLTEWARVSSTFAGHYDLAAYLVLVLALMTGGILVYRRLWQKFLIIIFILFAFYLLVLTASQISFAAYLIGVTCALVLSRKYFWIIPVVALSILAMANSTDLSKRYAATLRVNLDFFSGITQRKIEQTTLLPTSTPAPLPLAVLTPTSGEKTTRGSVSTLSPTPTPAPHPKTYFYYGSTEPTAPAELTAYRSVRIRFNVEWPRAVRAFLKDPLLGTGYSSITLATDNDYLRTLGETGILGFVALILIFLEIFRRAFVFLRSKCSSTNKAIIIGILGASLGFLINALFIDVLESSKIAFIFWILIGVLVGTIRVVEDKKIENG